MSRLTLALALTLASPAAAQAQRVSVPELRRSFASVQAAVSAIGAGRGTVRLAPGEYRECAVQEAGDVRIEAAPGTVTFVGTACEGKAALVLRGWSTSVVGVNFRGIRVPDRNGSGIRHEAGRLTVERSRFIVCAADLSDEQAAGLTAMYELTFVNLQSLGPHLQRLV